MNPLLLFYLLGMFDEKDEDGTNDLDLDYTPNGFFVLGAVIFWALIIFICWEIAKLL